MRRQLPDLRTAFLGAFGWVGALAGAGHGLILPVTLGAVLAVSAIALGRWRGSGAGLALVAALVVFGAVATAAGVRHERLSHNPLSRLAELRAGAVLTGVVSDDPRTIQGRFGEEVLVRLDVREVEADGRFFRLREPVLLFARQDWLAVPLGATVRVGGHLGVASGSDVAAVLSTSSSPDIRAGPDPWWRASARVRAALRESVARLPPDRRALVPALVDGDDAALDPALADDFRTTGLTHLLAVSGTNLTLVVGFALVVARWCRVRGRWLYVVGRRRDPRVRPPRPRRAECPPRGGDGVGRPARHGGERRRPRHARARCRHHRAAPRRPRAGVGRRVRALGPRHGRHPAAGAGMAGRDGAMDAPLAGGGDRGARRRPARVHTSGRGHRRPGEPGRRGGEPARGSGGGPGDRARPARRHRDARLAGRRSRRRMGGRVVRGVDRRRGAAWLEPADRGDRLGERASRLGGPDRSLRGARRPCSAAARPPGDRPRVLRADGRRGAGQAPDAGLAALRVADGRLRRRSGRRPGPGHGGGPRGGGGRCRTRPTPDGPLSRRPRCPADSADRADALPCRPCGRPAGRARRQAGRCAVGESPPGPAGRCGPGAIRGRAGEPAAGRGAVRRDPPHRRPLAGAGVAAARLADARSG